MSCREACEVAIVGAGPYGLAARAHLRAAGVDSRIFGQPMRFWETRMPAGMNLRSTWDASHIAHPDRRLTLDHYEREQKVSLSEPIPLGDFIRYGHWFQGRVAPDLDHRLVRQIEGQPEGFRLVLEDGQSLRARRVVIAAGIGNFAYRPSIFEGMPGDLVSHSSDHGDLLRFRGRRVVVVGGGQSAIETAALLHEAGAEVEVIVRAPRVNWLNQHAHWLRQRFGFLQPALYPKSDVGPPGLNLIVDTPGLFRLLPYSWQKPIAYRSIRPAATGWLKPRMAGVPITVGRNVRGAAREGAGIVIDLDDGTRRRPDHVLLATGFRVDVSRHGFLSPEIIKRVRCDEGYPRLRGGFESTVPGLHFVGAPAARSFGPLFRFVSGTAYMGKKLAAAIGRRSRKPRAAEEKSPLAWAGPTQPELDS
jgi:cation diffusion facilitator CzcD-associated flavoprotein CzcO